MSPERVSFGEKGTGHCFHVEGPKTENAREPTAKRLVGCEESGDLDARTMHASLTYTHTHTHTHIYMLAHACLHKTFYTRQCHFFFFFSIAIPHFG